jgi:phosphoglucosamine mutase
MSPAEVMALGCAAVEVLAPANLEGKPCVVIGRDTRLSSPMLEAALLAGLCSAGADVVLLGVIPSAGVAHLSQRLGAIAGAMVSASHNAYGDNGIKFFAPTGAKLDDRLEEAIEARLLVSDTVRHPITGKAVGGPRLYADPQRQYLEFLKSTLQHNTLAPLRIGLDCANGAASTVAPTLFTQLGAEVHVWHAMPDGCNINHQCGALYPEFLQQHVVRQGLDVGFAFDGDADRLIAIDRTGRILDGDYILAICAQDLCTSMEDTPRVVVSTVMANVGLERALRHQGIRLFKAPVGDKYVLQGMRQQGAILGGEPSGHVIFLKHLPTGDGLLTAIQLLNVMLIQRMPLAELAQVLHKFPQVLMNVPIHERRDPLDFPAVQQAVEQASSALGDDGRVVVRLSGTEHVARVMVEGPEHIMVAALAQRIVDAITHELGLP